MSQLSPYPQSLGSVVAGAVGHTHGAPNMPAHSHASTLSVPPPDWYEVKDRIDTLRGLGFPMNLDTLRLILEHSSREQENRRLEQQRQYHALEDWKIPCDPATGRPTAMGLLGLRLRLAAWPTVSAGGVSNNFKHIDAYHSETGAHVFVVTNDGKAVVIDDDPALFPSDALLTQIGLLTK